MNLHEYFGLCADHDWHYGNSYDKIRYIKGFNQGEILIQYYTDFPEVYNSWRNHIFNNGDLPKYEDFL